MRSSTLRALAIAAWCAFLLRALYVFAPGSPNVDFNSDSAIPVLMSVDESPLTPFNLYYYKQDRWGAWPFLVAQLFRYVTGFQWSPESLFVLHGLWIFSGSLVLAALTKRDAALLALSFVFALCLHVEARFMLFRLSQPYAWQMTGVLIAWLFVRKVFDSFVEGRAATAVERAGWVSSTFFASFLATASSTMSAAFLMTLLAVEALRARWQRSALNAPRGLLVPGLLGLLAVTLGVGAEHLQKAIFHRYVRSRFGRDLATNIELDWDHLATNLAKAWHNIVKLSWWPLYFLPALALAGFLGALVYARVRDRRELLQRLKALLAEDTTFVVIGAYAVSLVNAVIIVLVSHVRINEYDDRYLTPTNLFAPIAGLLSLLLVAKFFIRRAPALRGVEIAFGGALLAVLAVAFPARGSDERYWEQKHTALALARLVPDGVLMGGYWDTYFLSALQPEHALMPLPFQGQANRIPWSVARLKTASAVVVAFRRSSEKASSPPDKLKQYGVSLRLSDPRFYEDSEYVFAYYRNRASRRPRVRGGQDRQKSSLRRSYGPADFRLSDCARLGTDNVIEAENCPEGIVVFGPYVFVPGASNVEFSFELESTRRMHVTSDLTSGAGKTMHGGLPEQRVNTGSTQRSRQIVHVFEPVEDFESRIMVRTDGPGSFKIRNLSLSVF